ncbi:MAG: response regulator transcription factor [Planctomycetota bacterium]|nr:response regulator transcription factor [Planctomycetota bacterium]
MAKPPDEKDHRRRPADNQGEGIRVCLFRGMHIVQIAIQKLLQSIGFTVITIPDDEFAFEQWIKSDSSRNCDVIVLILSSGPFSTFHQVREILRKSSHSIPLAILAPQANRAQIYAALRIGAKAYVNLDAEPAELIKAIKMAAQNKVYLAPAAAELLVGDVSTAMQPNQSQGLPSMELSRREEEVVQLLCEGLSSKEIARRLHISPKTVENHRYRIYRKCEVETIAGLFRHAIQNGLVSV